jgi:hypothetical protein
MFTSTQPSRSRGDNNFAMTLIASQTHADVAAEGGNDMAAVIKQNRG